jgi:hypothetical protein
MTRLPIVFLVLSVVWAQYPKQSIAFDSYGQATPSLASIKFDPDDPFVFIPVRIGAKDYKFVLDTGFAESTFDATLRPHLGRCVDSECVTTPDGGEVKMDLYNPPDACVGTLPLTKGHVACQDLTSIRKASGCAIYGFAGLDFFSDRIVSIDFDAGRIDVLPGDTERDPKWGEALQFGVDEHNTMRVLVNVGERVWEPFIVDTGMNCTGDLSKTTLDRLIDLHDAHVTGTEGCLTLSGSSSRQIARISRLTFGSFRHENLRFTRAQYNVLGLKYFSRYRLTIDFRNRQLYLAKGKRFADHDRGSSLAIGLVFKAGKLEVVSVEERSPAYAAGIRPKDLIVKMSGQDIATWKSSKVVESLSAEGKSVHLTIERDGKQLELSFIPKEYD